ncbi:MAG: Rieske (2Fe-2S) protein [Elusimicrobia bacterium]|nr:Rieske (2Fe-2S) protein [Elusimicrobiota bacterium]
MNEAVDICGLESLPDGKPRAFYPLGLPVLLLRRGAEVFALENRCAHMGCPLSSGSLDGYTLRCPCHDWRFDVRDGKFLDAPEISLRTYPAAVKGGRVQLRLP